MIKQLIDTIGQKLIENRKDANALALIDDTQNQLNALQERLDSIKDKYSIYQCPKCNKSSFSKICQNCGYMIVGSFDEYHN